MTLRLTWLGPMVALSCELIGLLSLALTRDVERPLFLVPLALGLFAWLGRFRLPDSVLIFLVAGCVLMGFFSAASAPTGTIMARSLIPAHALLWLARDEAAYRFWRLGLALVELALAAILSPEVYMFLLIFGFVALGSLSLSLGFLERNFRARDPERVGRPLRPAFVAAVLALSFVIFLSSLLIFPVLPRSKWSGGGATTVGFSEVVSFRDSINSWMQQDGAPVLWIFRHDTKPWEALIPFYLLRGQSLEAFDGNEWSAALHLRDIQMPPSGAREGTLDMLRQELNSDLLPAPYGTLRAQMKSNSEVAHYARGDWISLGSRRRRVKYNIQFGAAPTNMLGTAPSPETLRLDARQFPQLVALGRELGMGTNSFDKKVERTWNFFRESRFEYDLIPIKAWKEGERHPVEEFLFDTKRGHCELFASAAALLMRSMGIPSRVVVGFRVRPPMRGNVLTVRSTDAHAWIEVWRVGRGWVPLDFSPVIVERGWAYEFAGELYDLVGAYWYRYILEYDFDFEWPVKKRWWALMLGLGGSLFLSGLYLWRRNKQPTDARQKITRLLSEFENDLLHRIGIFPEQAFENYPELKLWRDDYLRLRFGSRRPRAEDILQLRRSAKAFLVKVERAQASVR